MKIDILHSNKSEPDEGCTFDIESMTVLSKNKVHLLSLIIGMFLFCLPFTTFAQVQEDLRLQTDAYTEGKCPANDIQILGATLETDDPCVTCTPGSTVTADLKITMTNITGSDRYFAICATVTGGQTPINISRCYFAPANSTQIFDAGEITFNCGSVVTLDHILLAWTAASGECPVTLKNNPNGKYCFAIPPIIVRTPFVADPVSTCSTTQEGMMNVTLNISGGSGNFDFLWSDNSTLRDRVNIPIGNYTVTVFDNILKDGAGQRCSHVLNITAAVGCCVSPDAGQDGNTLVCDSSVTPIILADLITGEGAGGVWTRESGTGGIFNDAAGTFVPTGATTSTFKYLIGASAPCVPDFSIATVNVNHQPNAGTGGSTIVCDSSVASIALADLISGEEPGGTWTRESGTGGTFNNVAGTFVPTGATTSTFKYTLSATAPCVADDTVVTVNVNHQPNAGTGGSTIVCDSSVTPIILADLITGEEPGGAWTRESGTGGTFNDVAGTFVPTGATTSTFKYTLSATTPCVADDTTVTVNVNHQPDAGTGGSTTVCESSVTPIILADLITGEEPGGTWTQLTGSGGIFNAAAGTFVPAGASSSNTFRYSLSATAPCAADDTVVTVNLNAQPDAGTGGTTEVCIYSVDTIILANLITGEDPGGSWTRLTGTGGVFNDVAGTFVPTDATTSTFRYTLTATAPCVEDSSDVTVTVNPRPAIQCPASSLLNNVPCGVSAASAQASTDATFNTWFNSFVGANPNVQFVYSPLAAQPAVGNAPLNPILGVPGSIETQVTVTWTVTDPDTECINSCSAIFRVTYNCVISCNNLVTPVLCKGASTGSITVNAQGGTPPYAVNLYKLPDTVVPYRTAGPFNTAAISVLFDNLPAGSYNYLVNDATGVTQCRNAEVIVVDEPLTALDLVSLAPGSASCDASDGTILATISGGTPPYTIKLDGGSPVPVVGTTHTFMGVAAGPHTVTVYDANYAQSPQAGCTDSGNVTIEVAECPGKACTPGFWKTHAEVWDNQNDPTVGNMPGTLTTPVTPGGTFVASTNFFTYFDIPFANNTISTNSNLTMLGATGTGGGDCKALARHGVSALLGAAAFPGEYPFPAGTNSFSSLYNYIRNAFLSGNCEAVHQVLAGINEQFTGEHCGALGKLLPASVQVVQPQLEQSMFAAYPVPFRDYVNIRYEFNYHSKARIEIYDAKGMFVKAYDDADAYFNKEVRLDVDFTQGDGQMYIIKVITDNEVGTKRIISKQ